eukprot:gene16492-biopygen744
MPRSPGASETGVTLFKRRRLDGDADVSLSRRGSTLCRTRGETREGNTSLGEVIGIRERHCSQECATGAASGKKWGSTNTAPQAPLWIIGNKKMSTAAPQAPRLQHLQRRRCLFCNALHFSLCKARSGAVDATYTEPIDALPDISQLDSGE